MTNILIKFFQNQTKCSHKNALLYANEGYCPDCGEYLIKNYYIIRCSCCDIKREAKLFWGDVVPVNRFCINCGSEEFYVEKLDKINFINANYAICLKETANKTKDISLQTQVWSENVGVVKLLADNVQANTHFKIN